MTLLKCYSFFTKSSYICPPINLDHLIFRTLPLPTSQKIPNTGHTKNWKIKINNEVLSSIKILIVSYPFIPNISFLYSLWISFKYFFYNFFFGWEQAGRAGVEMDKVFGILIKQKFIKKWFFSDSLTCYLICYIPKALKNHFFHIFFFLLAHCWGKFWKWGSFGLIYWSACLFGRLWMGETALGRFLDLWMGNCALCCENVKVSRISLA